MLCSFKYFKFCQIIINRSSIDMPLFKLVYRASIQSLFESNVNTGNPAETLMNKASSIDNVIKKMTVELRDIEKVRNV